MSGDVAAAEAAVGILEELRRIMRAVHLHSRRLSTSFGVTGPELVCLKALSSAGVLTQKALGVRLGLSPSTVTRLLDRLEARGLAERRRDREDRRRHLVRLTSEGETLVGRAPLPLQERLLESLLAIPLQERRSILRSLRHLTEMIHAEGLDASPILAPGELT